MKEINANDLAAELRKGPRIVLSPAPAMLFHVIAALHLALRHPDFPVHVRSSVEEFIEEVKGNFGPLGQQIIDLGSDPANDQPMGKDITDDEFNEMLRGALHHQLPQFTMSRLILALRMVVAETGRAGAEALRAHCRERERRDAENADD